MSLVTASPQAPLYAPAGDYSVDTAVRGYIAAGCNASKLNLGVPFYARQWDAVPPGPNASLPGLNQTHTGPSEQTCRDSVAQCTPTYAEVCGAGRRRAPAADGWIALDR